MQCIFCGDVFCSSREDDKVCTTCERAIERLHIGMTPDRLRELSQAEKAGRLVVIPSPESGENAVLAAVFRGDENPIVMHGGGDLDDLIALTHLLVCYTAEVAGVGYADFCRGLFEMTPTTGFVAHREAAAAVEREEAKGNGDYNDR